MKPELKISFRAGNQEKIICFGEITEPEELDQMFKLRYEVYAEHDYIDPKRYPAGREKDYLDQAQKCRYLIAKLDDLVIGTVRVIQDEFLPTERECFRFAEPPGLKSIPRNRRMELGRLMAKKHRVNGKLLPRHLVLLGLLASAFELAVEKLGCEAGLAFVKKSVAKKVKLLGVPFHEIKPFVQVYAGEDLRRYFNQKNNPVFPIFFLKKELREYFNRLFNYPLIFERRSERDLRFKKFNPLKVALFRLSLLKKI